MAEGEDKEKGEDRERTVQKTYRLPITQVELIEQLAARGIYGGNRSAVVRTLIGNALEELIKSEFVRKYFETSELLKKGK